MDDFELLKSTYPFSILSDDEIKLLLDSAKVLKLKKGEFLFKKGDENKGVLFFIKKGLVELNVTKGDKKLLIGYRGEGETVGNIAYLTGKPYSSNVECIEDTEFLVFPKDVLDKISEKHPDIYRYLAQTISERVRTIYEEARRHISECVFNPSFFQRKIGEIINIGKVTYSSKDESILDIAKKMDREKTGAVVVLDQDRLCGIVSERDIVRKHIARGIGNRAKDIMTPNVIKVSLSDFCYKAAVEMIRHKIRHVVVEEAGKIIGMLDIIKLLETENYRYIETMEKIAEAEDFNELLETENTAKDVIESLIKGETPSREICEIITEINDEATKRAIELTLKEMEDEGLKPPCKFAFLVFGSHGRKEQTLRTDQDNAIIYEDGADPKFFESFASRITNNLEVIGFPKCPGNMMASNPFWRGSISEWREKIADLFVNPVPEKILNFSVFFDYRVIFGDIFFKEVIDNIIEDSKKEHPGFVARLARAASEKKPPIGLFGRFIVEKSGEHKNEMDIKARGCLPIIEAVRVLSLQFSISKTNTFDRVEELANMGVISRELANEVIFAYDFILKLRMRKHLDLIKKGLTPHNYINPSELTSIEKRILKESFATIYKLQREMLSQTEALYVV